MADQREAAPRQELARREKTRPLAPVEQRLAMNPLSVREFSNGRSRGGIRQRGLEFSPPVPGI